MRPLFHLRNVRQLTRIAYVLAKHDALFVLEELRVAPLIRFWVSAVTLGRKAEGRPGERLARAFEELGPTFIKLGQALSTRADLIGEAMADDLATLRDRVPPFPSYLAIETIEQELGAPLSTLFIHFEDEPVAAASIAQVHKATLPGGNEVAVKVLRPNIAKQFARDIALFYWIADLALRTDPTLKRLRLVEIVRTVEETVYIEMNLRMEAAAADELRSNFLDDPMFYVPEVDWQRTSQRVLTLEWVKGTQITQLDKLRKKRADLDKILAHASGVFFKQVFRDGFFHADMHPGNLFIGDNGKIIVVDFGIMGRLDKEARVFLAQTLLGFFQRDYYRVAELHVEYGIVPADKNIYHFAQACRAVGEPILDLPLHEISVGRLLGQLFELSRDFEMISQPQFLLLHKTIMMAEGLGRMINPKVNMWKLAEPLIREWAVVNLGPRAQIKQRLEDFREVGDHLRMLTNTIKTANMMITPEGIRIHADTLKVFTARSKGFKWWHIVLVALLGGVVGAQLMQNGWFHG